ncbi:hypothetical protein BKA69DRAFT_1025508 [Paraphysoderma sedebokerense]|nr:hypothetical protein BKA69DRAFT_1025508 [Paraphysoderma sedebokerense]
MHPNSQRPATPISLPQDPPQPSSSISRSNSLQCLKVDITHSLHSIKTAGSILCTALTPDLVFAGFQEGYIEVWCVHTFQKLATLKGHSRSVLCLTIAKNGTLLLSSSGDGTCRIWDIAKLKCVQIILAGENSGDIFSLVYSSRLDTIFIGCQNTSIQWFKLSTSSSVPPEIRRKRYVNRSFSYFFRETSIEDFVTDEEKNLPLPDIIFDDTTMYMAHHGYVYSLLLTTLPMGLEVLISGSGNGDIKIWDISSGAPSHIITLLNTNDSVMTLVAHDGLLFSGTQGGEIKIWDMETFQCIRQLVGHTDDIMSLCIRNKTLYSASADGLIKVWRRDLNFDCTQTLEQDSKTNIILSISISSDILVSATNDSTLKFWALPPAIPSTPTTNEDRGDSDTGAIEGQIDQAEDTMIFALQNWIRIKTVSGLPEFSEECRNGAKYLKSVLSQLGAQAKLIPTGDGKNPLVLGKFTSTYSPSSPSPLPSSISSSTPSRPRPLHILFYGHYDVQPASTRQWATHPFTLTGLNGYLYGRGISDDKGPIMATLFAVNALLEEGMLNCDITFLVEGEEESGSGGFKEAVKKLKETGEVKAADVILMSNSYWLGEEMPCITYGQRGVIHASVEVSGPEQDLHSGVDGGTVSEPLLDLIKILAGLLDSQQKVLIPGFLDDVRPLTAAESKQYDELVTSIKELKERYLKCWRYPTVTVSQISTSSPRNNRTVIPRVATASVSMRTVPNQCTADLTTKLTTHLRTLFSSLNTTNKLSIDINSWTDWWLGSPNDIVFRAASKAVEKVWGKEPLLVREGGSIVPVSWLEREFGVSVVNVPMGQSSDGAHLPNERIRILNLLNGRKVMIELIKELQDLWDGQRFDSDIDRV